MNALEPINISLKKIVEMLQKQNIHAQICKRPSILKECANNP